MMTLFKWETCPPKTMRSVHSMPNLAQKESMLVLQLWDVILRDSKLWPLASRRWWTHSFISAVLKGRDVGAPLMFGAGITGNGPTTSSMLSLQASHFSAQTSSTIPRQGATACRCEFRNTEDPTHLCSSMINSRKINRPAMSLSCIILVECCRSFRVIPTTARIHCNQHAAAEDPIPDVAGLIHNDSMKTA